jgi:hypothetical protein
MDCLEISSAGMLNMRKDDYKLRDPQSIYCFSIRCALPVSKASCDMLAGNMPQSKHSHKAFIPFMHHTLLGGPRRKEVTMQKSPDLHTSTKTLHIFDMLDG